MDNILAKAAACSAGVSAINAKLAASLRTADEAGDPDYSVVSRVGGGNGTEVEVLYAKTAAGAAGYSYRLSDGSFAKAAPATGDILTTALAQGQLQNIKDQMYAALSDSDSLDDFAPQEDWPDDNEGYFEACCCNWLKKFTNFSNPAQLFICLTDGELAAALIMQKT
jgi:hypothetical protein